MGKVGQIIGGILGIGGNFLGSIANKKAQQKQFENEKALMGLQANYNKEQARYSQELAKEMWNYTNYHNQVKQLKLAGLNPALIYGQGGGGGASTDGGEAQGVSIGTSQAVMMGLQAKAMEAEIAKTMAETAKITTETEKTGIDIGVSQAEQELKGALKTQAEQNAILLGKKGVLTEEEIKQTNANWKLIYERLRGVVMDNEIKEETKQNQIDIVATQLINEQLKSALMVTEGQMNEAQAKYMVEQTLWIGYDAQTRRMDQQARERYINEEIKKIEKELEKMGVDIKLSKQANLREWIYGGVNAASGLVKAIIDALPTSKIVKMITETTKGVFTTESETVTKKGK